MRLVRLLLLALLVSVSSYAMAQNPYTVRLVINGVGGGVPQNWPGGIGVFSAVSSNWNSGTVTLEYEGPDGITFVVAGTNATCTANCGGVFYLPAGKIEAVLSGSPTALYASVGQVQVP